MQTALKSLLLTPEGSYWKVQFLKQKVLWYINAVGNLYQSRIPLRDFVTFVPVCENDGQRVEVGKLVKNGCCWT